LYERIYPPRTFVLNLLRGLLLFALLLQYTPPPPTPVIAAVLPDTPHQDSPPNTEPIYGEPFADILPPVMPTDLSATPTITPSLPVEIILDLDRAVVALDETALLTITVEVAGSTPITDVTLTLTLPPGIMTTASATGIMTWTVPATSQASILTQVVALTLDQRALAESTAVVPLDVYLTAPGYATGYWTTMLGLTLLPSSREIGDRSSLSEVHQGVAGAVLQAGAGLITLLVEPAAVPIDTAFSFEELYNWGQTGVSAGLTVPESLSTTVPMSTPVTRAPGNEGNHQLLLPFAANTRGVETSDEIDTTAVRPQSAIDSGRTLSTTTWNDAGVDLYYSWQLAATRGSQTVTAFDEPVQLLIDLAPLIQAGVDPEALQLWTRPDALTRWVWVRADYDVAQQQLVAWVSAFGQFGLGAGLSQRGDMLPSVVGAVPDRLTGGISLQYPIETPAGVGGLHPNLSFAYSSVSADDLFLDGERKYLSQSSGVGLGWSVAGSANYIVRTDNKLDNNTIDTLKSFSLVLNGMRVGIRFEEGEWRTDPETFYRVIWDGSSSNTGGVTDWGGWLLVAPDGTKYEFGDNADFNAASTSSPTVTYIERKSDGTYRLANQWYLRRVSDPLGNEIEYQYTTERSSISNDCDKKRASSDLWYRSAVYPKEIRWNSNSSRGLSHKLRVSFGYKTEDRRDYQIQYHETNECQQIKFAKRDWLQTVTVEALVNGNWIKQRSYQLENGYGFTWNTDNYSYSTDLGRHVKRLLLHGLRVLGANDGLLQRYTFTYQKQGNNNPNQIHLVTADNGWGGKVTYTLDDYRVGCHTLICGGTGTRDIRFAVVSTQVEDGISNRYYTTYEYGPTAPASGEEWGHIGIEDGSAQFFGFQRSEATYYADSTKTRVMKWDAQDAWPPKRSDSGGADPRSGKPKRLETRVSAAGAVVSITNYTWLAYRRDAGKWVTTDSNDLRTNTQTTYPIIWVRQESEERWTAGGNWETSGYGINGNGIGRQIKTLYDNSDNVRGYGNILAVQEYSHPSAWITLADWTALLGDSSRKPIRETKTDYFPNTTTYIVNKPARVRIYADNACKVETRYIYSNLNGNYTSQPSSTALLVKTEQLLVKSTQALDVCSDAGNIDTYDANWAITRMAYDLFGNQTILAQVGNASDGGQNLVINTTYDSIYQLFPVSQNLNGSSTYVETARYYGVNEINGHSGVLIWGAMQEHCGVNEVCTRQVYDQFGRRARRWEGVGKSNNWDLIDDNALVVWLYSTFGGTQSANTITEWRNPRNEGNFVRKLYNGLGQLIQEQRPYQGWAIGAGQEILVDYLYDALGNQTRVGTPRLATSYSSGDLRRPAVWTGGYTQTDYDARNLVAQTIAPNGEQQQYGYTGRAWAVIGLGRNGDSDKVLRWEESDPLGRLQYVRTYTASNSDSERVKQVNLTHDTLGNLTDVSHPDNVGATAIRYDLGGRKISMDDPDLGSWRYQYDRQGKLIRQTDGRKQTTCLYYDTFGRLISKYFRDDSNATTIDACPPQGLISDDVSYNYDEDHNSTNRSRGQVTSIRNNGVAPKKLLYNSQGLLAKETITIVGAPQSYSTTHGYDSYLRPSTTTYPDDEIVTVSYNGMGLPSRLTSNRSTTPLVDNVNYDAAGRLTQMVYPAGGNLNRTQTYWPWKGSANNSNGRLREIKVGTSNGATDRLWLRYYYDTFGNIGRLIEQYNGGGTASLLFCYDAQNRLVRGHDRYNTSLTYPQNCAADNQTGRLYTYDGAGRLTTTTTLN
jgi:YD repeat-containing protein